jgi:hypothetical protein
MHSHHYVSVHVVSEDTLAWMAYYIHHKYKGTHHSVCVGQLSDVSVQGMLNYILHSHKGS